MSFCVKCDHEIPSGASFCPQCGATVASVISAPPVERAPKSEVISQMPKLDGQEIAKIFDHFITAVRDYARGMEDVFIDSGKKSLEQMGVDGVDARRLIQETFKLDQNMVQPLELIRDKVSKCRSPTELESVVDSLIKLFQDKVHVGETQTAQVYRDMWSKYLQILAALALEINDYCIKQYFPTQKDLVYVRMNVSKGFLTPAPLAPIKVYFNSDFIQYGFTTRKGEAIFKLPKGREYTFWTLKDGNTASKTIFLSGDTKIKL